MHSAPGSPDDPSHLRAIIEALVFAAVEPLTNSADNNAKCFSIASKAIMPPESRPIAFPSSALRGWR